MCYYDTFKLSCGCWKWGNFRSQCDREWRMGETCGLKIFNEVYPQDGICTICDKLKKKENRYAKTMSDYNRWKDDPKKQASAEKAAGEARELWTEMEALKEERARRYMNVGSNRRRPVNDNAVNNHAAMNGHVVRNGNGVVYGNGVRNGQ